MLARKYSDTKAVLVLSRPSLSNTYIFKAGETLNVSVAMLQKAPNGGKVFGQGTVQWFILESTDAGAMQTFLATATTALAFALAPFLF